MTIQKAIKSGKPFRRKAWGKEYPSDWYCYPKSGFRLGLHVFPFVNCWPEMRSHVGMIHDILATDWEVKQ